MRLRRKLGDTASAFLTKTPANKKTAFCTKGRLGATHKSRLCEDVEKATFAREGRLYAFNKKA
jgi:hypothetical protein